MSDEDARGAAEEVQARLAEFTALRNEIDHSQNRQTQILGFAITAFTVMFGLATENVVFLLFVPPIALILQLLYTRHQAQVQRIGGYIRTEIEPNVPGLGWEGHFQPLCGLDRRAGFPWGRLVLQHTVPAFFLLPLAISCVLYAALVLPGSGATAALLGELLLICYLLGGIFAFLVWRSVLWETAPPEEADPASKLPG